MPFNRWEYEVELHRKYLDFKRQAEQMEELVFQNRVQNQIAKLEQISARLAALETQKEMGPVVAGLDIHVLLARIEKLEGEIKAMKARMGKHA